jgi:hypothetical protein
MTRFRNVLCISVLILGAAGSSLAARAKYLVTNDDNNLANTISFYQPGGTATAPTLTLKKSVKTGGRGLGGGYFASSRVVFASDTSEECIFASEAGSTDIAGLVLSTQQVTGRFRGSRGDSGGLVGIGLVSLGQYLYASFTGSYTIATFQIQSGCTLKFLKDVDAVGRNLGSAAGMAASGNILVVAYSDGSIASFNITNGVPVSNNDEQLSTGTMQELGLPSGVIITKDGHYAIFGDSSGATVVEVSDISSGKLTATVPYSLGLAKDSTNVTLSPDETLLYITNSEGGTVTAAFFDSTTGVVTPGCASAPLKNYNNPWIYSGAIATEGTTGTGQVLFLAEDGPTSSVGILTVSSSNGTCTLSETSNSPVTDANSPALLSIQTYP